MTAEVRVTPMVPSHLLVSVRPSELTVIASRDGWECGLRTKSQNAALR